MLLEKIAVAIINSTIVRPALFFLIFCASIRLDSLNLPTHYFSAQTVRGLL